LAVPGLGASFPFFIDDGIAAAFARAYELGLYGQRSGMATTLPFTRFTHAADHTTPKHPTRNHSCTAWSIIASYGAATIQTIRRKPRLCSRTRRRNFFHL